MTVEDTTYYLLGILTAFYRNHKRIPNTSQWFYWLNTLKFKSFAVAEMFNIITNQELVLHKKYSNLNRKGIDDNYLEEARQMAYFDAFLQSVYSLTEMIAQLSKSINSNLPSHFHDQKSKLNKNSKIYPKLAELMNSLGWYDAFREIRTEITHYGGNDFLVWQSELNTSKSRSLISIHVRSARNNKILTEKEYIFDFKNVRTIKNGVLSLLGLWAKIIIEEIDPGSETNASILNKDGSFKKTKIVKLEDVLSGKEKIAFNKTF